MAISKIQTGDRIKVITGKYKGTIGSVVEIKVKILPKGKLSKRVSISTIPKITKYRKAASYQGESYPGEKLAVNRTIDISNVQLITPDNLLSRSKVELKDGKKIRTYTKNQTQILKEKNELIEKKVN